LLVDYSSLPLSNAFQDLNSDVFKLPIFDKIPITFQEKSMTNSTSTSLSLKEKLTLASAGVILAVVIIAAIFLVGSLLPKSSTSSTSSSSVATATPLSQLGINDTQVGTGAAVKSGDTVTVHYTGKLRKTGVKFDSSLDSGKPASFVIGVGQVIPGWDQGLIGMKVGGKRTLEIPAALGYGAQAQGPIPANSDLIFDIELLDTKATPAADASSSISTNSQQ